jgi:peptide/nickel transport system substrate-binding protein
VGAGKTLLHGAMKVSGALLAALFLLSPVARAQEPGFCGTIVLPTGGGDGPSADITSFSPLFSDTAYNQESGWLMYPDLLWINRFEKIDWSRSLASAVSVSPDDTIFTVTMRPWHWSDGVAVTAEDAAYFYRLIKQLGPTWTGYGAGGLPDIIKQFVVVSPAVFKIVTTHSVNPTWFIYNALTTFQPLPEHAWKRYTLDEMFALQSSPSFYDVVDGPLKVQKLEVGLDAIFVPNPAWEGPKMHFSRLIFDFLQGDGAVMQGAESGDLDVAPVASDLFAAARHQPGMHMEALRGSTYQNVINLNLKNPKVAFLRDARVRQAMEDAIDQNAIVKNLFHGYADTAYGPVPSAMGAFLTPAMQAGNYPVGYDPAKARALLRAAGYTPGPDGIMQKDGKRLSFVYLEQSGSDAVVELDETVQADFRKVGIEMNIHQIDFNQMLALMAGSPNAWAASGTGQSVQDYPSGEAQYETGAYQNMGGYSDPEMDRLINANVNSAGQDKLFAYETYASAQQPVIWEPREWPVVLVRDRLHGMANFLDPVGMFAPDQLTCSGGPTA